MLALDLLWQLLRFLHWFHVVCLKMLRPGSLFQISPSSLSPEVMIHKSEVFPALIFSDTIFLGGRKSDPPIPPKSQQRGDCQEAWLSSPPTNEVFTCFQRQWKKLSGKKKQPYLPKGGGPSIKPRNIILIISPNGSFPCGWQNIPANSN